jgi:hypothetical protein
MDTKNQWPDMAETQDPPLPKSPSLLPSQDLYESLWTCAEIECGLSTYARSTKIPLAILLAFQTPYLRCHS